MPSGTLYKHLVSSLNRRSFVSDLNKQKLVEQSALLPNAPCQMNREYLWTHIPEQRKTLALQEAENSKPASLGKPKENSGIHLRNFPPLLSAIYTHLNLNHMLPQFPKVLWTPPILLSSETSNPSHYPLPPLLMSFPSRGLSVSEVFIGRKKK